ncbi:MAG: S41 family peptidase [Bacilli bacterium]
MKKEIKRGFRCREVILISLLSSIVFLVVGAFVGYYQSNKIEYKYKDINDQKLQEFIEIYESLNEDYYQDLNKGELIDGAIDGMLKALEDPYTTYMDESEMIAFNERMNGDYEGIGALISIDNDGDVIISQPFDGSPAAKAGLMPFDKIISVDNKSAEGLTTEEVASMIKGEEGTTVFIKIKRKDEEKTFNITRKAITVDYISSKMYEKNNKKIGYISIETFSSNSYIQFKDELLALEKKGIDSLIIDVRNNAGGYLDRVSQIISLFLPEDKVIYQLETKDETIKVKSYSKESREYDVVVLINEFSASASEILAGAFKDSYGSEIIGVNSYGKGTVQRTYTLETGGMVKLTVEKWLTPSGKWINDKGIEPTVKVKLNDSYYDDLNEKNDNQLQKAIEVLAK